MISPELAASITLGVIFFIWIFYEFIKMNKRDNEKKLLKYFIITLVSSIIFTVIIYEIGTTCQNIREDIIKLL